MLREILGPEDSVTAETLASDLDFLSTKPIELLVPRPGS